MSRCALALLCGALSGACPALAQQFKPLPKAAFIESFKGLAPEALCKEERPFVKCLDISKRTCVKAASAYITECARTRDAEIPAVITNMDAARNAGKILGECVGKRLGETYTTNITQAACLIWEGFKAR